MSEAPQTAWAIKDWSRRFQTGELERKVKIWRYVPVPISLAGERFRTLMETAQGREAFGAFVAVCEVAANLPVRGVLCDERGPLSNRSISIRTGIPVESVAQSVDILSGPNIGWLIKLPYPDVVRIPSGGHPDSAEQNRAQLTSAQQRARGRPDDVRTDLQSSSVLTGWLTDHRIGEPCASQIALAGLRLVDAERLWDASQGARKPVAAFVAAAKRHLGIDRARPGIGAAVNGAVSLANERLKLARANERRINP